MNVSKARERYIFTAKIELPNDDTSEEVDYIVLREPSVEEMQLFGDDEKKHMEVLKKIFPKCLVDHSFVNEDGTKTRQEDVYAVLKESSSLYTEIIDAWLKSIPFRARLKKDES
ncbi:MAG: hypothetical protein LBU17_01705 [Treponema sp.]|jgi:hypothetical protein|nr:hypothetical protein [Treponema sp.]